MDIIESDWDGIELTPIPKAAGVKEFQVDQPVGILPDLSNSLLDTIKRNISSELKALDESFMYLGILKKLALPDAMTLFKTRLPLIFLFLEKIRENEKFPEKETLFSEIGEDYPSLSQLIHSGEAVLPIFEHLKTLYACVEDMKKAGIKQQDVIFLLHTLAHER